MKNLIFCLAFMVSLVIIIIGLCKSDYGIIQSGTSLFFFMLAAFSGTVISETRKKEIDTRVVKIVIPLFLITITCIIVGAYTEYMVLAGVISFLLGIISCCAILFYHKK